MTEEEKQFYLDAAINAMQGLMENSTKLGVLVDLDLRLLAKRSFDTADHMLEEYRKRINIDKNVLETR